MRQTLMLGAGSKGSIWQKIKNGIFGVNPVNAGQYQNCSRDIMMDKEKAPATGEFECFHNMFFTGTKDAEIFSYLLYAPFLFLTKREKV